MFCTQNGILEPPPSAINFQFSHIGTHFKSKSSREILEFASMLYSELRENQIKTTDE